MLRTIDECFFQIQNGANIKQGVVDGGFPITRIETTANDKFNRDRMGYAGIIDIGKYESYVLEDGDLLMSHINSVQYLGRTVIYEAQDNEIIIHGMNLLRLKARRDIINPAYARYCFYGQPFRRQISNITKKSVNQASFAVTDLKKIKIEVPALDEQNKVVDTLNKLQKIIDMRNCELEQLDDLIKARFVEMFGDPIINPNAYKRITLNDACTKVTDGTHDTPERYEEGVLLLTGKNIRATGITFDDVEYVSEEDHRIIYDRCNPEYGDVLYTNIGVNYGTACFNNLDYEFSMKNVALLKPKRELLDGHYLWICLNYMRDYILSQNQVGGAQTFMGLATIKKISIPVPSINLQKQFAEFLVQIDKSKFMKIDYMNKTRRFCA